MSRYFLIFLVVVFCNSKTLQDVSSTALWLGQDMFFSSGDSMSERLGELRNTSSKNGIWLRSFGAKFSTKNITPLSLSVNHIGVLGGYDRAFGFLNANNFLGVFFGYRFANSTSETLLDGAGKKLGFIADGKALEFGIYNSYVSDYGIYYDSSLRFLGISNDVAVLMERTYGTNNFALALGQEVGYRYDAGDDFYIDFSLGAILGYLSPTSLNREALNLAIDDVFSLRTKSSLELGYGFYKSDFLSIDLRGRMSLVNDFARGYFGGVVSHINANDNRMFLGFGTDIKFGEHSRFYMDMKKGFGGKINVEHMVSVGLRFVFGGSEVRGLANQE